jgi:integrase
MGKFKVPYLVAKASGRNVLFYWQPRRWFYIEGEKTPCPFTPRRVAKATNELADAVKEAKEWNKLLDEWRIGNVAQQPLYQRGTFGWLVTQYIQDSRYRKLRDSTKDWYQHMLPMLLDVFTDVPLNKITRQLAREFYLVHENKQRKAQALTGLARTIMHFGRDIGEVAENPFEQMRIPKPKPRQEVWPLDEIEKVKVAALELGYSSIALATQLALDTGQRAGDLRDLTWNRYDGKAIKLRQSKTGVWIEVPLLSALQKMLDSTDRSVPHILICEGTQKPYSKDMLSRKFREACEKAGIDKKYQFRDLRRTAVVRLAEAGCTNAEIAAITGHSLQDTVNILEVYLPRNSTMAISAIEKIKARRSKFDY